MPSNDRFAVRKTLRLSFHKFLSSTNLMNTNLEKGQHLNEKYPASFVLLVQKAPYLGYFQTVSLQCRINIYLF
jgi:hypothetical protein